MSHTVSSERRAGPCICPRSRGQSRGSGPTRHASTVDRLMWSGSFRSACRGSAELRGRKGRFIRCGGVAGRSWARFVPLETFAGFTRRLIAIPQSGDRSAPQSPASWAEMPETRRRPGLAIALAGPRKSALSDYGNAPGRSWTPSAPRRANIDQDLSWSGEYRDKTSQAKVSLERGATQGSLACRLLSAPEPFGCPIWAALDPGSRSSQPLDQLTFLENNLSRAVETSFSRKPRPRLACWTRDHGA